MFGAMKKRQSREPSESAAVTKNVEVALWSSQDAEGRPSFRWSLSRLDRDGVLRKTFKPEHLADFVEVIRVLAQSFSQLTTLEDAQRAEFVRLASQMEQATSQLRPSGLAAEKAASIGRILS
jgi:predicted ArsR family transcriptional regulator